MFPDFTTLSELSPNFEYAPHVFTATDNFLPEDSTRYSLTLSAVAGVAFSAVPQIFGGKCIIFGPQQQIPLIFDWHTYGALVGVGWDCILNSAGTLFVLEVFYRPKGNR